MTRKSSSLVEVARSVAALLLHLLVTVEPPDSVGPPEMESNGPASTEPSEQNQQEAEHTHTKKKQREEEGEEQAEGFHGDSSISPPQ